MHLVQPNLDCPCLCCAAGAPCARVLLLSHKDNSDASRLWARFAEHGPGKVNLKVAPAEQRAAKEAREPTSPVKCRACGAMYPLPVYLAAFLAEHRAPAPDCAKCRANEPSQASWSNQ